MTYHPQRDGEWVQPRRGYRMACCDCGLVHRMAFRVVDGRVQFRAWRDDAATKARRADVAGFLSNADGQRFTAPRDKKDDDDGEGPWVQCPCCGSTWGFLHEEESQGRDIAVKRTCDRCGHVFYEPGLGKVTA